MTKQKRGKAHAEQKHAESVFVCAPCQKECSGETSLLQHCMGQEHYRRAGHRGFAGCIPNKLGLIPPLSDDFFVRIAAGPAALELQPPPEQSVPASAAGAGAVGCLPVPPPGQTDKFFHTQYKCAACGTTVSGHISFVEHCRGKAHIKTAGFSGFAGLLPNEAGIIPPVPSQLLAAPPASQAPHPVEFAPAAAAAAAAMAAGQPLPGAPTAPVAAAAPVPAPTPPPEKKAVSVRMDYASLTALSQAARAHDQEHRSGKTTAERAAEKAAKAAARALEKGKVAGNRAGPVPPLEVPFGPLAEDREKLPIASYRENVLSSMRESQVTVLQGDTGCGKTTQVPQFILEEAAANGTHISIVCTQPRRISAMGVAERVASERGEAVKRWRSHEDTCAPKHNARHALSLSSSPPPPPPTPLRFPLTS